MIIIEKEKTKFLIKGRLRIKKETLKIILIITVCIFVLFEVFVYARQYYTNNNLCFTKEDKFLFTIFIAGIITICVLIIYLIIKQKTLVELLKEVYQAIINSEHNLIELERSTQEMILKLFSKGKK